MAKCIVCWGESDGMFCEKCWDWFLETKLERVGERLMSFEEMDDVIRMTREKVEQKETK